MTRLIVLSFIVLVLIGWIIRLGNDDANKPVASSGNDDAYKPVASAAPPADPVEQAQPRDEAALMMEDQAFHEVRAAPNDIIERQVEDHWAKAFCTAVGNVKNFSNWTGRVSRIRDNGYFVVRLGGEGGGLIIEDIGIVPGSDLYRAISGLHYNQPIKMSGYLTRVTCETWYDYDIEVHFTSISPL
jgi:hypothetical protein